jgi:hypothetical protein
MESREQREIETARGRIADFQAHPTATAKRTSTPSAAAGEDLPELMDRFRSGVHEVRNESRSPRNKCCRTRVTRLLGRSHPTPLTTRWETTRYTKHINRRPLDDPVYHHIRCTQGLLSFVENRAIFLLP